MVRNAGKFGKPKRGGSRNFTNFEHMHKAPPSESSSGSEGTSDEESSEEENISHAETAVPTGRSIAEDRAARRAAKKDKKVALAIEEEGSDVEGSPAEDGAGNLNRSLKKNLKLSEVGGNEAELSRKEREAAEKKTQQEAYWKLHQEGKTSQAKADLARLAKIRAERAAAKAVRDANQEIKDQEIQRHAEQSQKKLAK